MALLNRAIQTLLLLVLLTAVELLAFFLLLFVGIDLPGQLIAGHHALMPPVVPAWDQKYPAVPWVLPAAPTPQTEPKRPPWMGPQGLPIQYRP